MMYLEILKNRMFVVLAAITASLLLVEVALRVLAPALSENIANILNIPNTVNDYSREGSSGKEVALILGNSLIDHAVDTQYMDQEGVKTAPNGVAHYKVVPDGTSVWDWYCIAKNDLSKSGYAPDTIVLGYAWGYVPPVPSRLSRHFCSFGDLRDLHGMGMTSTSQVVEYILAKFSYMYALRETLSKRILDLVIPDYRENIRIVNETNRQYTPVDPVSTIPDRESVLLDKFSRLVEKIGSRLVLIAMPVVERYPLDGDVIELVEKNGGVVLDYRGLEGISSDMFEDPIHLNERGQKVFTRRLSADLAELQSL